MNESTTWPEYEAIQEIGIQLGLALTHRDITHLAQKACQTRLKQAKDFDKERMAMMERIEVLEAQQWKVRPTIHCYCGTCGADKIEKKAREEEEHTKMLETLAKWFPDTYVKYQLRKEFENDLNKLRSDMLDAVRKLQSCE